MCTGDPATRPLTPSVGYEYHDDKAWTKAWMASRRPKGATLAHSPPCGPSFARGSVNKNQFGCLNSQMVVRTVILGTDCSGIDAPLFALKQLASSIGSRVEYAFASDVWLVLYRALTPTESPTTTAPGWAGANRHGKGQRLRAGTNWQGLTVAGGHTLVRTSNCGRTHIGKD